MWYELGGFLGVDTNILDGLLNLSYSDGIKMSKMLQNFLDNQPTPATWNNIIDVIEGPLQKKILADEIRQKFYQVSISIISSSSQLFCVLESLTNEIKPQLF